MMILVLKADPCGPHTPVSVQWGPLMARGRSNSVLKANSIAGDIVYNYKCTAKKKKKKSLFTVSDSCRWWWWPLPE